MSALATAPYPVALRDILYKAFEDAVRTRSGEVRLGWAGLAARKAPCTLAELTREGAARGLDAAELPALLSSGFFRLEGAGPVLGFSPTAAPHREFLRDRLPRYLAVLAAQPAAGRHGFEADLAWGQCLFNHGLFFDCHEYLEARWRVAEGAMKRFLKGLIQAGAALHKIEKEPGPATAQAALGTLSNALTHLDAARGVLGLGSDRLEPLRAIRARLAAGRITLSDLPRLDLLP